MSFLSLLYLLFIGPLELFFETVFSIANSHVSNPGFAIIVLSLIINILVLPMYNRAEKVQEEQREIENKLNPGINHIKKTHSGDQRFLLLQTYYRFYNYSPIMSLRGAMSLLLQIPFFIAAYNMLSSLKILEGVSFGPIHDLSQQDGLIVIGALTLNALPIIMTLVNIISGMIYTKGHPLKEKVQLYGMALVFLVLLYSSPAGLVFYWTLNNVFSLGKNIVLWAIKKIRTKASSAVSVSPKSKDSKEASEETNPTKNLKKPNTSIFVFSSLFIALFVGGVIPSLTINASPIEFVTPGVYGNPIVYVADSLAIAIGLFVIWFGVFYYLVPQKYRGYFSVAMSFLAVVAAYDFYLAPTPATAPNNSFVYPLFYVYKFSNEQISEYLLTYLLILAVIVILYRYISVIQKYLMLIIALVALTATIINCSNINNVYDSFVKPDTNPDINITLSSTERNVVVIMIDRGLGYAIDDIFENNPDLMDTYDGFTYYPNTVSFGAHTNIASPSLYGGYEYSPQRINERSDESLASKQNEALSVLPVLFSTNGYDVTVIDPPYTGYQEISDTTIFDDYQNINCYFMGSNLVPNREEFDGEFNDFRERNLFCYSLLRTAPCFMKNLIYNFGDYNNPDNMFSFSHKIFSSSYASGYDYTAYCDYSAISNLDSITNISNSSDGGLVVFTNTLTHDVVMTSTPGFTYDYEANFDPSVCASTEFDSETIHRVYYGINASALYRLGEWFDYLREQGVYDNTRIIVVSDHGYTIGVDDANWIDGTVESVEGYNPVLLVKDFDSEGFNVSDEFMMSADVPYLVVNNLIDNPVNPFSGNLITNEYKDSDDITISASADYNINYINGNVLEGSEWITIHNHSMNPADWEYFIEAA